MAQIQFTPSNEESVTLNLDDPFDAVIKEMIDLHKAKASDYAGDEDQFQNFVDSATQTNDVAGKSIETLIATKQARLRHLLFTDRKPKNEAVRDTLVDRAVYSVISVGAFDSGLYDYE